MHHYWKVVLCLACVDVTGVTAFIQKDSEEIYVDANPALAKLVRSTTSSDFFCVHDEAVIAAIHTDDFSKESCDCIVLCGRSEVEQKSRDQIVSYAVCMSRLCTRAEATKDGWAFGGGGTKFFWSKNSWMTPPKANIKDEFPAQSSNALNWHNRDGVATDIDSMIAFMVLLAEGLRVKGISLYLDFCDVNPICHGLNRQGYDQWKAGSDHQKALMADLATGVTQTNVMLPQKDSAGAFCGAEFAMGRIMIENGVTIAPQLPLSGALKYGADSYADVFALTGKMDEFIGMVTSAVNAARPGSREGDFDQNFDTSRDNGNWKNDVFELHQKGDEILNWAEHEVFVETGLVGG